MGSPDNKKMSEIVGRVRSWIPRRTEHLNMSRDFWMPDQSCRVCYDCDSQFTIFNRRHHCRICGRVFCAKCTTNSVPAPSDEFKTGLDDVERIRVCNYCFKQWEQGLATVDSCMTASSPGISPSPSATSLVSTQSSCTCNSGSSVGSTPYSTGPYQHVPYSSAESPSQSKQMNEAGVEQDQALAGKSDSIDARDHFSDKLDSSSRSDEEEEDYRVDRLHAEPSHFSSDVYYGDQNCNDSNQVYESHKVHSGGKKLEPSSIRSSLPRETAEAYNSDVAKRYGEEADGLSNDVTGEVAPQYDQNDTVAEPLDFEKNGLLWHPPEPEDEEDEREAPPLDDDEYSGEGLIGEWGYLRSSGSFAAREQRNRDRSSEEHRKAMKNLLDGHFRALISQLLQIESLPVSEEDSKESWLDIITSLSWEAATLLKPDMSKSGGMDPGGYVKVKCVACGRRSESTVVKGVVCKKNVAHRRMTSKFDKPRFLILGGALEYQRVANHLSSFDTLLQQEMDHLKMAVAKIHAHHPNVLLVEKSVSRFAQEYLLAKDISLVLNIKRPLLERIARCTGAQIVPSVDHLSTQKLGYCDSFHVDKFVEEHGSAGQGGRKLTKTLMFFEGCPRPLGCTILLKGANGDELKKVKHVIHYGVFAAYHLALETSFLADEGASLPELPLKSPIKVALPDKPLSTDKSISTIPGFTTSVTEKPQSPQTPGGKYQYRSSSFSCNTSPLSEVKYDLSNDPSATQNAQNLVNSVASFYPSRNNFSGQGEFFGHHAQEERGKDGVPCNESSGAEISGRCSSEVGDDSLNNSSSNHEVGGHFDARVLHTSSTILKLVSAEQDIHGQGNQVLSPKQEYPPTASDHQSILVSLTTRCVWKGSVCERRLFRIKYYGSFDRPLGRFLRDHLFDQNYRCRSCEMPSEAHIRCYTHRQGSITIAVRKLHDFHLPGEREGKIWMWHRCLRCPRTNGFPPATRRVVMSDAAWGLSFGKFLELSFSNHVAASRVANCGHSLHRDCLRFYGFGKMVACFRYAPIDVHSVYLPPQKLVFNYDNQDWVQKEVDEVRSRIEILFAEAAKVLNQFLEKMPADNENKAPSSLQQIAVLEGMLQMEKIEYEELFRQVTNGERKASQPAVDILEVNRLRRQLIFLSYIWDQRLIQLSTFNNNSLQSMGSSIPKGMEKTVGFGDKPPEIPAISRPGKGFSSCESFLLNVNPNIAFVQYSPNQVNKQNHIDQDSCCLKDAEVYSHSGASMNHPNSTEPSTTVRRVLSEGQFPVVENLSDTLDAAWTGESQSVNTNSNRNAVESSDWGIIDASTGIGCKASHGMDNCGSDRDGGELTNSLSCSSFTKGPENMENSWSGLQMPFLSLFHSLNRNTPTNMQKLDKISEYSPVYILSFRELLHQSGARLLLPVGINDIVVPVYDDEPTSIISYALASTDYHTQVFDQAEKLKDGLGSTTSLPILELVNLFSLPSADEAALESRKSIGSTDESIASLSSSRSFSNLDPPFYADGLHVRVSFSDDGPLGKVKYTVTCYYAKKFEALRRACCPSELDFIRSLSRCKKWGAQGGKSNVFFAKTLDDRFIIKQVTKTELESFIKFAPSYFKYLSESLSTGSPTCLAKILGIYQVTSKHLKGGKESKMDVLVMENLLFRRNIMRLYDLKGSCRSRYNSDSSGSNKVLLDQNLLESMPTSPIFVGTKAKQLLERAVWNDTSFLASIDVMDYSLLVGVDEDNHELVVGIIDFMRQYTWDKHLETWVKASGILGGPKNTTPTVISPMQYKKRFRKAMSAYFLMVPDQWSSSTTIASGSQSDLLEDNTRGGESK